MLLNNLCMFIAKIRNIITFCNINKCSLVPIHVNDLFFLTERCNSSIEFRVQSTTTEAVKALTERSQY